jgi:hypothetical protein
MKTCTGYEAGSTGVVRGYSAPGPLEWRQLLECGSELYRFRAKAPEGCALYDATTTEWPFEGGVAVGRRPLRKARAVNKRKTTAVNAPRAIRRLNEVDQMNLQSTNDSGTPRHQQRRMKCHGTSAELL